MLRGMPPAGAEGGAIADSRQGEGGEDRDAADRHARRAQSRAPITSRRSTRSIPISPQYGVTLYPFFLEGVAADPKLNQKDGLHPNKAGVEKIVAAMLPAVEKLIGAVAALSACLQGDYSTSSAVSGGRAMRTPLSVTTIGRSMRIGVGGHEPDEFRLAPLRGGEAEAFVQRLPLAHQAARVDAQGRHQLLEPASARRLAQIFDHLELVAAFADELQDLARGLAAGVVVDGDFHDRPPRRQSAGIVKTPCQWER